MTQHYTPAKVTLASHGSPCYRPPVRRLRAPDALSGQVAGVRRLYWHLAAQADPRGYATLNLTALSQQWGRPRTTLIYWYEKLRRLRLLQEVDPGGGRGRPKLVRVVRFMETFPQWRSDG